MKALQRAFCHHQAVLYKIWYIQDVVSLLTQDLS